MPAPTSRDQNSCKEPAVLVDPVERFKHTTLKKLEGLTCDSHGKRPTVAFHGASLRDIRISMRCCCGKLSALANLAIARPGAN